jgi:hypothetical protein
MRAVFGLIGALLVAALISGCVSPARTGAQYQARARSALEAASSELGTTLLVVRQVQARRALRPYADEVATASETALGSIQESFGSVQPADPASDGVRDGVGDVLSSAESAVGHARIALRRPGTDELKDVVSELLDADSGVDDALARLG